MSGSSEIILRVYNKEEFCAESIYLGVNVRGYSIRMYSVKPSAIRSVQKRIASKQGVISFAAGLPDPDLFPMDDLKNSTMEMIEMQG